MDLSKVSTQELLQALIERRDLIDHDGMTVYPEGFTLLTKLDTVPCTDIVGVRVNHGMVEACAITRAGGPYNGRRLTMIGGRVPYGIHFEDSLRNHIREDLGVEIIILSGINYPDFVWPYSREKRSGGWGHDPTKFALGLTYLATFDWEKVCFSKKLRSGPEASGLHWFSRNTLPSEEQFGYGHYTPFLRCLEKASVVPELFLQLPHVR